MKPKVFITRKISSDVLLELRAHCDVEMWQSEDTPVPKKILEEKMSYVDGVLTLLTEEIDRGLLQGAKNLKVISNMAVGYNNIDIKSATEKGIIVTNTPGVLVETTADLTFGLLMAASRRLIESNRYVMEGRWETWSPQLLTGQDIHGATLGIIGLGDIGQAVACRAKGFNMKILYHNRSRKLEAEEHLDAEYVPLRELLEESDFVCVLAPYTDETKNLIGEEQLKWMKPSSVLINTARGGIVDEEALYTALTTGEIWAAGLDVFEHEPATPDLQPLLALPNVVALPHIGSASIKTRTEMAELAAVNLLKALFKDDLLHVVNREVFNR